MEPLWSLTKQKLTQIPVFLIGLTYSINDGTDWNGTYTKNGIVSATNLSCYFQGPDCPTVNPQVVSQVLAHSYGDQSLKSECGPYEDISEVLRSKQNNEYYCRRTPGRQEFAFRFKEYNPKDRMKIYPFFTDRIITASSGNCMNYSEVGNSPGFNINGVRDALAYEYRNKNGSFHGNVSIPIPNGALGGTTYMYRDTNVPEDADAFACGPRCIRMLAHINVGEGEESTFYECPVTVYSVSNTTQDAHIISDGMARLAAASIGLGGRYDNGARKERWPHFTFYPVG